ncbi:MAG: hypothetical protein N2110_02855 [Flavobacteriales bacterium]|nr:hypothetical protein [Flavobacteriales bacterium]MCX7767945.1 hypothetical protein [Flavobacteriales bacterium]MDW8410808.1 hypothetical protein [Flavobacteriales bacterium]
MSKPDSGWWAVLLSAPLLGYGTYYFRGFVQDDAFIYLRVAQVFLEHGNLGYNPGVRVEAFTGFLWQWLCIGILKLHLPPIVTLKIISFILALGTQYFLYKLSLQVLQSGWWAMGITLLLALYPPRVLWFSSGLEMELFLFSVVWASAAFIKAISVNTTQGFYRVSLVLAFAVLSRPEALILLAAVLVALWAEKRTRRLEYVLAILTLPVIVFSGLTVFRYIYFGLPLPNTYYAKAAGGIWLMKKGVYALRDFGYRNFNTVFTTFSLFGWLLLFGEKRRKSEAIFLSTGWSGFVLHYLKSGGDLMAEDRLLLPACPSMLISAGVFAQNMAQWLNQWLTSLSRREYLGWMPYFLTIALYGAAGFHYYNFKWKHELLGYKEVLDALNSCHGQIGRYMNSRALPGDKAVVTDAGMTAWQAPNVYFIDFLGLGDTTTSQIFYRNNFIPWIYTYCFWKEACDKAHKNVLRDMNHYFLKEYPRWVVCNLICKENSKEQKELLNAVNDLPDTIPPSFVQHIIFWSYFSVFNNDSIRIQYKPILFYAYNPTYYLMLVEKRKLP